MKIEHDVTSEGKVDELEESVLDFASGPGVRAVWCGPADTDDESVDVWPIQHNSFARMPSASLVKVLVVEELLLGLPEAELDVPRVRVGDLSSTKLPSVLVARSTDDRLTWRELCALSIITSDNSTADYLVESIDLDRLNSRLQNLGLRETRVACGFTDDLLGKAGRANSTCAGDMAQVFRRMWTKRSEYPYDQILTWLANNLRNNRLPAFLPDDVVVMHKTGSLKGVVNDAGIVDGKIPFVMVALMDGQEDSIASSAEIGQLCAKMYQTVQDRM